MGEDVEVGVEMKDQARAATSAIYRAGGISGSLILLRLALLFYMLD